MGENSSSIYRSGLVAIIGTVDNIRTGFSGVPENINYEVLISSVMSIAGEALKFGDELQEIEATEGK